MFQDYCGQKRKLISVMIIIFHLIILKLNAPASARAVAASLRRRRRPASPRRRAAPSAAAARATRPPIGVEQRARIVNAIEAGAAVLLVDGEQTLGEALRVSEASFANRGSQNIIL